MTRWKAFGIHLAISFVIFAVLVALIYCVWYPGEMIQLGGWQGVRIVAGVDLVLGPLLTLIVFNSAKKSLKWDLSAIAALQVSCLAVGVWIVYQERPLYQVFSVDGVHVLNVKNFETYAIDQERLPEFGDGAPMLVYLDLPEGDADVAAVRMVTEFVEEKPLEYRVDLYKPIDGQPPSALTRRLSRFDKNEALDCYKMPLHSSHLLDATACFSLRDGIVKIKG